MWTCEGMGKNHSQSIILLPNKNSKSHTKTKYMSSNEYGPSAANKDIL